VKTDEKGYKSVNYSNMTAVLLEAMKEQQKQINTLTNENKELKQKVSDIDKLKAEVEELKTLIGQSAKK
jgi:Tfp pilus assembly protein PilN